MAVKENKKRVALKPTIKKVKTYGKKKLIALIVGIIALIVLVYAASYFAIQPYIDQAFFKQHPDAGMVTHTLQKKYPDAKIFVRIDENIFHYNGKTTKTTIFSVQHRSSKLLLTGKEMQDIAKQTCSILKTQKTTYDKVLVLSLKYTLPFKLAEVHRGIRKPCIDWETQDYSDIKFPY